MAELTLPWVVEARGGGGTDWDRTQRIRRVLRGCGESPGFVEDWLLAGALDRSDVDALVDAIATKPLVTLAHLCRPCRQYRGPAFDDSQLDGLDDFEQEPAWAARQENRAPVGRPRYLS